MPITIENPNNYTFPFEHESLTNVIVEKILNTEQCPYEPDITLILTDDQEIRNTNKAHRQIDRETDVLSFPMVDFTNPGNYDILENSINTYFHPDSGELMLGDIMLSVPRAKEQAKAYGHTLKREFAFLIAHSVLHLLGYDHMTPEDAASMEGKQEAILQALNITR